MSSQKKLPEKFLIPILKNYQKFLAPQTSNIAFEVDSGYGIADIVFFNSDKVEVAERKKVHVSPIKSYEILETLAVINKIDKNLIEVEELFGMLPYSRNAFRNRILKFLYTNNFITLKDNFIEVTFRYQSLLKETVAIEAKVANWQRGFYQAFRYKKFADYSYLAMHKDFVQRAYLNLNLFKKFNIGLISVDTVNKNLEVLFSPKKPNIVAEKVKFYASEDIFLKHHFQN